MVATLISMHDIFPCEFITMKWLKEIQGLRIWILKLQNLSLTPKSHSESNWLHREDVKTMMEI